MSNGESNGESTTPTQETAAPNNGAPPPVVAEPAAQHPVEDPEHLNERRKSVGLGPIEAYLKDTGAKWKQ